MADGSNDVIVVGAGSAGCALAAGLAARGARVELLEAGPSPDAAPGRGQDATNCDLSGRLDWGYVARVTGGRTVSVPRGRALGGSSAINTCVALRPDPASFAAWARQGAGWGWGNVLPYFKRIESDKDFPSAPYHGDGGPVPVVRWREEELELASCSFLEAARAAGLPDVRDLNAPGATGIGCVPMNRLGRWRASAERVYLGDRPHSLLVGVRRQIDKLVLRGTKVVGLTSRGTGGERVHKADRIVLCAGAYGTPAILLRSGIGPSDQLARAGLPVVHDLPGVGRGLFDHSQVHLVAAGPATDGTHPSLQVLARVTTPGSNVENDVQLCVLNRVDLPRFAPGLDDDQHVLVMFCALLQHSRSRGQVRLVLRDPDISPSIEIDYVAHRDDRRRYREALRLLSRVAAREELAAFTLLDGESVIDMDDEQVDALVACRVQSAHHPMGTARMGGPSDRHAVVGDDLAVLGVDGLSIADASVIPVCVNANIHLTCTMIGERAADLLS